MKLSVSLPAEDVEFLDAYAETQGISSRSAVVHKALRLLSASELGGAYEAAWKEWTDSPDAALWEGTSSDGFG